MDYINVQLYDLPVSINGLVVRNSDGGHTIFINSRLSRDAQIKAYKHELKHIENNDFDNESGNIEEIHRRLEL